MSVDLRDYFAAQAMQALIQASASLRPRLDDDFIEECSFEYAVANGVNSEIGMSGEEADGTQFRYSWARHYAEEAYYLADEMVRQRERK